MKTETLEKRTTKKLEQYIQRKYNALFCKKVLSSQKAYARILFQHKICSDGKLKTFGKNGGFIARNKICEYQDGRCISPDLFYKANNETGLYILGEAKSTKDKTGREPGSIFSCAHRIVKDLVRDKRLSNDEYEGYTRSFIAQSLGYLDAVIHIKDKLGLKKIYFVWLICDGDGLGNTFYQGFGKHLTYNIKGLFPGIPCCLIFKKYESLNNIEHYYTFKVCPTAVMQICRRMCREFIKKYPQHLS